MAAQSSLREDMAMAIRAGALEGLCARGRACDC